MTDPVPEAVAPPPAPQPKRRRRAVRLLLRLLLGLLVVVLLLVVSVACFALFPPSDLVRRAVLPVVRQALNHENLQIGALKLRPLSHIEIQDLWLGPPRGFKKPMFTVKRIVVRHDISQAANGLIRVKQVQVERPFIAVENQAGKLNWIAFLERLPKGEETPEEEKPEGEPSKMRIFIDRVAVIGFGADVDDGIHKAQLDSLHLAVWGLITPERNDAHVTLRLEPPRSGRHSLSALIRSPGKKPLGGRLVTNLRLDIRATMRPNLRADLKPDIRARVDLDLDLSSQSLVAPWDVPPVSLATRLRAEADTETDRGQVKELSVRFNKTELLRLSAALKGVFKPARVKLLLSRLHLPLELFTPYLRAVDDSVDAGGTVGVRDLKLDAELSGKKLPRLSGVVTLEKLWATVRQPKLKADLRDLNVKLALGTRPGTSGGKSPSPSTVMRSLPSLTREPDASRLEQPAEGAPPSVMIHGQVRLGRASAAGATLSNLDLRLTSGAHLQGLSALSAFGSAVRLRIPAVSYLHPKLGAIRLGLRTDLRAKGDWSRKQISLDLLRVDLPDLLGMELSARAEDLGKRALALDLKLMPAPLGKLIARLPRGVRRQIGTARIGGKVNVGLKVKGRLPKALFAGKGLSPAQALGLPLSLDTRIGLKGIQVKDKQRKLQLLGLGGVITCKGRPSDLRLDTDLRIKTISKPDQHAVVQGLRLPLKVHFTPKKLQTKLKLTAQQLFKGDMGLSTRGLALGLDLTTALPPLRRLLGRGPPPVGRTRLVLTHGVDSFRMASPGSTVQTGPIENRMELAYLPGDARNTRLDFTSRISRATQAEQRAKVHGLTVSGKIRASLPVRRLMANKPAKVGKVSGQISTVIKALRAAAPGNSVKGKDLSIKVALDHDPARPDAAQAHVKLKLGTLDHYQQRVRLRNLTLEESSKVEGIVLTLPKPVIKLKRVNNQISLKLGSVHKHGLRTFKNSSLEVITDVTRELQDYALRRLALRVPTAGVRVDLSGKATNVMTAAKARFRQLPTFDLSLDAALDNPMARSYRRATPLLPGLRVAGNAGAKFRAHHSGGNRVTLDARLLATAFHLWSAAGAVQRKKDGSSVTTVTRLHLRNLNMDVPLKQSVTLGRAFAVRLPRPKRSIFDQSASSDGVLYSALRPYSGRRTELSIGGINVKQTFTAKDPAGKVISTVRRKTNLDRMGLNLAINQSTLLLNRLYLKLFSGDIAGAVQAQVLKLNPVGPPDVRVKLKTQITGVNLAYLDPKATKRTAETEVSALIDLEAEPCRRHVKGRITITSLSLKMLDSLLAFIDPNGVDENVQKNRKLINSWYVKLANPKVKLVSIWINFGNLNMDIDIDAIEPAGALIRGTLRRSRIRRLPILWLLENSVRCHRTRKAPGKTSKKTPERSPEEKP